MIIMNLDPEGFALNPKLLPTVSVNERAPVWNSASLEQPVSPCIYCYCLVGLPRRRDDDACIYAAISY